MASPFDFIKAIFNRIATFFTGETKHQPSAKTPASSGTPTADQDPVSALPAKPSLSPSKPVLSGPDARLQIESVPKSLNFYLTESSMYANEEPYLAQFNNKKLKERLLANPILFFKTLKDFNSEKARRRYIEIIFEEVTDKDITFIKAHFFKLANSFRYNSDFFKFIKNLIVGKKPGLEQEIQMLIKQSDEKAFAILDNAKRMGAVERSNFDGTSYLDKLANTKVGEHSHETLIDAMLSDKRIFFTLINWLNISADKGVTAISHPAFAGRLDSLFEDRYDWSNFLGACRNIEEVNAMIAMVPVLFEKNPKLKDKYNPNQIGLLLQEVKGVMETPEIKGHIEKNQKSYPDIFLTTFYKQIYNRLFRPVNESALVIESSTVHILNQQRSVVPEYIRRPNGVGDTGTSDFEPEDYKGKILSAIYSFVEYSKDMCRNENVQFLSDPLWQRMNMGLGVSFDRPESATVLGHAIDNIPGVQQEQIYTGPPLRNVSVNVCQPFLSGNCWDQASVQFLHLALFGPDPKLGNPPKTVLHVGNEHADHSYCIITSLTMKQIENLDLLDDRDGNISMLKLFKMDPTAVLSDPWAKAIFKEPQLGLHYAEYPHNDTSQPKVPVNKQDVISITSMCTIGDPKSVKRFDVSEPLTEKDAQKPRIRAMMEHIGQYKPDRVQLGNLRNEFELPVVRRRGLRASGNEEV